MGRPQHRVRNNSSESLPLEDDDVCPLWVLPCCCWVVRFHSRGGREDEQARQSGTVVVLEFESEFRDISFLSSFELFQGRRRIGSQKKSHVSTAAAASRSRDTCIEL
jgi:hypothetical protein